MSRPMTPAEWEDALWKEGVSFVVRDGWTEHNRNHRGPFSDVKGVMIHHTAGKDSQRLVYSGTSELPGPLAHAHLSKQGRVTMVSSGRANHAGAGGANAYEAVRAETAHHPRPGPDKIDGNAHFYGIEIENLGDGKDPYPAEQYRQAVLWAAAICRHHGWTQDSVIGHKEWTRRKIDPSFSMDAFRADVSKRLLGVPPTPPKAEPTVHPQSYRDVVQTDAIPSPSWDKGNPYWTLETYVRHLVATQEKILDRISRVEERLR